MQIIVLDKLDYCATLRNLDSVKGHKNMKARMPPSHPRTHRVPVVHICVEHVSG
jgi:hypothetical protein